MILLKPGVYICLYLHLSYKCGLKINNSTPNEGQQDKPSNQFHLFGVGKSTWMHSHLWSLLTDKFLPEKQHQIYITAPPKNWNGNQGINASILCLFFTLAQLTGGTLRKGMTWPLACFLDVDAACCVMFHDASFIVIISYVYCDLVSDDVFGTVRLWCLCQTDNKGIIILDVDVQWIMFAMNCGCCRFREPK